MWTLLCLLRKNHLKLELNSKYMRNGSKQPPATQGLCPLPWSGEGPHHLIAHSPHCRLVAAPAKPDQGINKLVSDLFCCRFGLSKRILCQRPCGLGPESLSHASVRKDWIEKPGSCGLPLGCSLSINGSESMDGLIWFLCPAGVGEL